MTEDKATYHVGMSDERLAILRRERARWTAWDALEALDEIDRLKARNAFWVALWREAKDLGPLEDAPPEWRQHEADARLGRMLRRMPEDSYYLNHNFGKWYWLTSTDIELGDYQFSANTPDAALEALGLGEEQTE